MQFVFFHGSFVGPKDGWIPEVSRTLIGIGQDVLMPTFPTDNWDTVIKMGDKAKITKQNLNTWMDTFQNQILHQIKQPTCFIGHSLGPLFILHVLEKFQIKLDSAIFVVPFLRSPKLTDYWQIEAANNTFYRENFDFTLLKKLIPTSYALYSDNDPYIQTQLTLEFCQKLGSQPILVKGGQHLSMDSGWKDFPLVTELCKTRINAKLYKSD